MTASLIAGIYQGLKAAEAQCSTTSSIDKLSIKVYEKQIFNSDFHPTHVYLFGLSFLTTLNIYIRIILRAVKCCISVKQSCVHANCELETKFALVYLSLEEAVVFVHLRVS